MIPLKVRRVISMILIFFLFPGLVTGCSLRTGLTAARMGASLQKDPVTGMSGILSSTLTEEKYDTGIFSEFQADWDNSGTSFWEADNQFQVLGVKIPQEIQAFGRQSGEEREYFLHLEKPDLWASIPVDRKLQTFMEPGPGLLLFLAEQAGSRGSLTSQDSMDGESSTLEFLLNGEEIMELLRQGGVPMPKDLIHFDFRRVSIPVSLTVNDNTWRPESLKLSVQGLEGEEARALLKACGIHTSGKTERASIELTISEFHFGERVLPSLPQEAVEKAVDLEALRKTLRKLFP